jgi:ABC-2 type transport system permease protein
LGGCLVIWVELVKLFRRARTWISVMLICALPFAVAVFIAVTHLAPPPGQGSAFLSAVLSDGALYPAAALAIVLPVFLPVAVAVVAGDSIAGEATAGTLRYLLVRPVGRTRLLVAKLLSVTTYVMFAVIAVTVTAYATGVLLLGPSRAAAVGQAPPALGNGVTGLPPGAIGAPAAGTSTSTPAGGAVTSLSGTPLSMLQLAERVIGAMAFITVSMLGVAAIALFLSTITDSALGSALGALAALVASEVLVTLNAATVIQPYLPTRYWLAWIDFFRQPIFWRDIQRGFAIQAVYVAVFLAASWANFATKDITA